MNFARPEWLYALIPAVLGLGLIAYVAERSVWHRLRRFATPALVGELTANYSRLRAGLKLFLGLLGVAAIMAALARPQWGFAWQESEARGIDVMIALDTSRSMLAEDFAPNRLERSKLAIYDLLLRLEGDRIGLIAFAGTAFLQCPLTLDYDAFRQTLDAIDTDTIPQGGTNIAAAIREAQSYFEDSGNFRILILITDGEDLEAAGLQQAEAAAQENIKIYTVGVGSEEGELIPIRDRQGRRDYLRDASGQPVKSRLDSPTLLAIAATTKASYAPLGANGEGLLQIYQNSLEAIPEEELGQQTIRVPLEQFQWPLVIALGALILEFLMGTRRRRPRISGSFSLLFLALLLSFSPSVSEAGTVGQAQSLYQRGHYEKSAELYRQALEEEPEDSRLHFNLGASLYRAGHYDEAASAFSSALETDDPALQQDAFFNLGNSAFQQGQQAVAENPQLAKVYWDQALVGYDQALAMEPEDEDARKNRALVEQAIQSITHTITLDPQPAEGGTVEGGGRFIRGSQIEISAQPAEFFRFLQWHAAELEDAESPATTLTVTQDETVIAEFIRTYYLEVLSSDEKAGSAERSDRYDADSDVEIKASSNDYFAFKRWISDGLEVADTSAPETMVTLTRDGTVTAEFVDAYKLEVTLDPPLAGQAGPSGFFEVNTEVPIQASIREGFEWETWLGEGIAEPAEENTSISMSEDRAITAQAKRIWNFIAVPERDDAGTVTGSGDFPVGTETPITATANEGFSFDHWEGPGVADPKSPETTATVQPGEHDVIAVFTSEDQQDDDSQDDSEENESEDSDSQNQQDQDQQDQDQQDQDQQDNQENEEEQDNQSPQPQPEEPQQEQPPQREPGQMTQEEAAQLLNALRESEKKLPAGEEVDVLAPRQEGRDW